MYSLSAAHEMSHSEKSGGVWSGATDHNQLRTRQMVSTVDPTSVEIPCLHCLVMISCCVLIRCLLSADPQGEELWMHVCGAPAEGTATLFCESNPLFCGSDPFCYSCHELVYMRLIGVDVLDWNLPRVGVCTPVCCAVGPLEMLDGQSALPMMCEH